MADNDSSEGKAPPKAAYRAPEPKVTPKTLDDVKAELLTPTVVKPPPLRVGISSPASAAVKPAAAKPAVPAAPAAKVAPDAFAAEMDAAKAEVRSTMSTLLASLIRRVGKLLQVGLGQRLTGGKRKPRT
jgi:hypothetical protein